jgi:phycocyanobilin lyase alpha subunit
MDATPTALLTIEQAIADLNSPDQGKRYYAAWWLGRFRVRSPEAVAALINALTDESDLTPDGGFPLRRNAARALGKLADPQAVLPLIGCLSCSDYYVREAAAQALAAIADPVAIAPLLELLTEEEDAAKPLPGSPHLAQPFDAILEAVGVLGATEAIPLVESFLNHPVVLVQYSAARAMYQLTGKAEYGDRLITALKGDQLQLRRAALADLGAIGYLPAAEAIANTLAENSLKLISLRGLLAAELKKQTDSRLSDAAKQVMQMMDSLL